LDGIITELVDWFAFFYRGKSLLSEKSELSRALEKHKVNQTRKMVEEEKISSRSEIERALEERAKKLEEVSSRGFTILSLSASPKDPPPIFWKM